MRDISHHWTYTVHTNILAKMNYEIKWVWVMGKQFVLNFLFKLMKNRKKISKKLVIKVSWHCHLGLLCPKLCSPAWPGQRRWAPMWRTTRHPAPSDTSQHWPATWAATCPGTRSPSSSSSPRRALYDRSQILEEGKLVCRNCSCQKSQEQLMFQDLRIWLACAFLLDAILPFVLKKSPISFSSPHKGKV